MRRAVPSPSLARSDWSFLRRLLRSQWNGEPPPRRYPQQVMKFIVEQGLLPSSTRLVRNSKPYRNCRIPLDLILDSSRSRLRLCPGRHVYVAT